MIQGDFITEAVFSDGTEQFLSPSEPMPNETITIRIRTAVCNTDAISLIANGKSYEMEKSESNERFDYYALTIPVGEERLNYYFQLVYRERQYFYCRIGIQDYETCQKYPFYVIPGFSTPSWAKGAVIYQIFVDRFCNGDVGNDVRSREYFYLGNYCKRTEKWDKYPAAMSVREFYGGDLEGIRKKLDYLEELGIEAIYLSPIFVSPSNHKYDTQDYDNVDPHYGVIVNDTGELLPEGETDNKKASLYQSRVTDGKNLTESNRLFSKLVEEAHQRGIRVILDGVFNHCGSFNKWMDREGIYSDAPGYEKGAYVTEDSPYREFFNFKKGEWPNNPHYEGWWGHNTLPKLNYEESEQLQQYILSIAKKWLSAPYGIDGWRLDVAADLGKTPEFNHYFWQRFRTTVKNTNPQAVILAEHYGDPHDWLQGGEWDSVMNYDAFMEPITWFLTGMEKHSYESNPSLYGNYDYFYEVMNHSMTRFPTPSLQIAMNELSNHDHSRFLTRTNRRVGRSSDQGPQSANEGVNPAILREAVVMQFTWPGAPTVYYGDEVGVCGWSDPDNRRTYPWGKEDKALLRFHKEIIRIHKSYQALKTGSIIFLCGENGVLTYGRFDQTDRFIIALNNSDQVVELAIPAWKTGLLDKEPVCTLLRTEQNGYDFEARIYHLENGILHTSMQPYSAVIWKNITDLI